MKFDLPISVQRILHGLEDMGYEAYVVGGCVRDMVMQRTPHDWDITTSARPEEVKEVFSQCQVLETGLQHGTVTVVMDGQGFEVTTYRIDGASADHRRPESVVFTSRIEEDLYRRDFTANAMAYRPQTGILDPFGGQADIKSKVIRCVGRPEDRFREDALRMLRALRFASVLDFQIANDVSGALVRHQHLIDAVSAERIQWELVKLLDGIAVERVLRGHTELLGQAFPELKPLFGYHQHNPHHNLNAWEHTARSVALAPVGICRIVMLLHDMAKPQCCTRENGIAHYYGHAEKGAEMAAAFLRRLRFDNATIASVRKLVKYHDIQIPPEKKTVRRWLNKMGESCFWELLSVRHADIFAQSIYQRFEKLSNLAALETALSEVLDEKLCFTLKDLAVNGRDLIGIGIPQGKAIGVILKQLLELVMDESVPNERAVLLQTALMQQGRECSQL